MTSREAWLDDTGNTLDLTPQTSSSPDLRQEGEPHVCDLYRLSTRSKRRPRRRPVPRPLRAVGADVVFTDVAGIEPGHDFRRIIRAASDFLRRAARDHRQELAQRAGRGRTMPAR